MKRKRVSKRVRLALLYYFVQQIINRDSPGYSPGYIGGYGSYHFGNKIIKQQKSESIEREKPLKTQREEELENLLKAINNIPVQQQQIEIRKRLNELKQKSSPQRKAVTGRN